MANLSDLMTELDYCKGRLAANNVAALATYELTNDGPGISTRDISRSLSDAKDALEEALDSTCVAQRSIEKWRQRI
jgi:hypothetical protein